MLLNNTILRAYALIKRDCTSHQCFVSVLPRRRAIHWLAESIELHSEQYHKEIKKRRTGNISRLTEYLSDTVIPIIFVDDKRFEAELKNQLNELGEIYRKNRNQAGHPRNVVPNWPREDQEILLIQFRRYITTIYKAIEECQAKTALRQQEVT